jgi:hypothetical protein
VDDSRFCTVESFVLRRALQFAAFKKAFNREGRKEMPQVRQEESSGKTEFGKNNERRTNI